MGFSLKNQESTLKEEPCALTSTPSPSFDSDEDKKQLANRKQNKSTAGPSMAVGTQHTEVLSLKDESNSLAFGPENLISELASRNHIPVFFLRIHVKVMGSSI